MLSGKFNTKKYFLVDKQCDDDDEFGLTMKSVTNAERNCFSIFHLIVAGLLFGFKAKLKAP